MKNILLFTLIILSSSACVSQIFVSNNSAIYAKNTVVYSRGNIALNGLNSNFYLRNEAQLVQGTSGASTNTGLGKLSVYQEGTSDNYDYNYWCSPIGNPSALVGNEPFGITMLHNPTTNTVSTPAVMLGSSYNGISSPLSISTYWIWKFLAGATYSQWIQSAANSDILAGQGFTMKGTSGTDATNIGETAVNNPGSAQRYDFRGKPNDGNIGVNVALNNFTLTGNPYPSALHVNAFLLDPTNTDCTGVAYYWEQDKSVNSHLIAAYRGGYGTFSPVGTGPTDYGVYVPATFNSYNLDGSLNTTGLSSGLSIQRKYAPIGQGFMIRGAATGTPTAVTIKNSHRSFYKESNTYSDFDKNATTQNTVNTDEVRAVSYLRLNTIMNNEFTRQTALILVPQATDGVDKGIDAKSPADESLPNDTYFFLDNDKYVIEGVSFDVTKRVPIGVKVTNNTMFKFQLLEAISFDENQPVYIYDALDGSYHNLKESDYEVVINQGTYNNRFELTFLDSLLSNPNVAVVDNLKAIQNNKNQLLSIYNPNSLTLKSMSLYDITGKVVINKSVLGTENKYEVSTASLSEGVYIVKVETTDNMTLNQKIIVDKNK